MRCQNCSAENPQGAKFCIRCATPFQNRCQKCGFENPSEARFCAQCAAPLDAVAPIRAESEPRDGLTAERRHLTVLFCDLVNSTSIAAQLDPEEWREIVAGYHHAAAQAIERFGGRVAQYLGDGVMAFFGYPEAHDNDAERAARAGLAILDAISKLNENLTCPKLSARIGIDSGAVVVGGGAGKEADVFGDTPNLAARVQAAAAPDTVLVTAATHRLVSGLFVVEDRGAQALKGVERPVQLYRVIQPSGVRGRLGAAAAVHGLTPFVGREDELRTLLGRWERVLDGEGQVALIVGEAGIGKSRLVQRFHELIAGTPHSWVEATAGPFFQNTPFYPVTELLRDLLMWRGDESAEKALARLEQALELARVKPEALSLIAPLLNLPIPAKYPPSPLSPDQQRRRLMATLVEWAVGTARVQPLVIATEDLHWADPSTLELIQVLVDQGATARLLLLYTTRPEFRPHWPLRAHHRQIMLNRLPDRQVREMVENVAGRNLLRPQTLETIVARTTGVPLFVEELTRDVMERGEDSTQHQIPTSLHDSLMERLDRLGPAREVAQIGAGIGREFSYELLRAIAGLTDDKLQTALNRLVDAELIYARGVAPSASYVFKHALVRDVAHSTLLKSQRRELHRRIAETLTERFLETAASAPELVARHYTEAALPAQAVRYWRKAGRSANDRSAYTEAISHFNKGLELVKNLPETLERTSEELRLQIALTSPLTATKGYTAPEVETAGRRALELCQQIGEDRKLFAALARLYSFYANRGDFGRGLELSREMLRLAENVQEPVFLVWAHYCLAHTLSMLGELETARAHMEQSLAHYDFEHLHEYGFIQDPGATGLALSAHVLYSLGYPDQALRRGLKGLAHARKLSHPYTLVWVLNSVGAIHARRGEFDNAEKLYTEQVALSREQNFPSFLASGIVGQYLATTEREPEEAISRIRESSELFPTAQANPEQQTYLIRLAYAYKKLRWPLEGLAVVAKALELIHETGGSVFATECYRLKGDLLLMENTDSESEAQHCFRVAIRLARAQSAKIPELQATASLARLLDKQGRRDEARAMLADIYGWFTEGFDTADLKDAKALLEELSA
jgi:class 3 adenylate cyclase/tetratricopeptide (TPR) repeat protein